MPELVLFGVCRSAIVDNEDHSVSLISLLSGFEINTEAYPDWTPTAPQATVVIPMEWAAVSLWKVLPEDISVSFEQKVDIFFPDGTMATNMELQGTSVFELGDTNTHTIKITVNGFPVRITGSYSVKLFLRRTGIGVLPGDYPTPRTKLIVLH
jgi:hypothetical protein